MIRTALFVALMLAGCGGTTGPELENPPPNPQGEWSLATIDGVPLPAPAPIRGATVMVMGSRLHMAADHTWTGGLEFHDGQRANVIEFRGDWSQAGDRVTLAQDGGCTDSAILTETRLRIANDCDFGLDLVFTR